MIKIAKKGQFVEDTLINILIWLLLLFVVIGIYFLFNEKSISIWKGLINWK